MRIDCWYKWLNSGGNKISRDSWGQAQEREREKWDPSGTVRSTDGNEVFRKAFLTSRHGNMEGWQYGPRLGFRGWFWGVEGSGPPALYCAVWLDWILFGRPLLARVHLEVLWDSRHMKQSDPMVFVSSRLLSGPKGKMLCIVQCAARTERINRPLSISLTKFISSSQSPDFSSLAPLPAWSRPFHSHPPLGHTTQPRIDQLVIWPPLLWKLSRSPKLWVEHGFGEFALYASFPTYPNTP